MKRTLTQPTLPPDCDWCETCGGEGIVWTGEGPVETMEQCEECCGECYTDATC